MHATCVSLAGAGVLLRGPSGAGKSDLALRLIDGGALLVADDLVLLRDCGGRVWASAPDELAGLLEVRGVGILPVPHVPDMRLVLVADLVAAGDVDRIPAAETAVLCGHPLPRVAISPFEVSAVAKLRLAVSVAATRTSPVPARFAAITAGERP